MMTGRFIIVWNFIKLTRPLFLAGGFLLYLLGVLTAIYEGIPFNLQRLVIGQLLVTSIQLMTHYSNEYYDREGDQINATRTWFSGGSGVLAKGIFTPGLARTAAAIFAGFAVVVLLAASMQVPAVLFLGLLSLLAAWSYSGPPLALVGTGWGELSASLVVAFFVPIVGYMMQSGGSVSPTILVICVPLILIHFAMLIAFQIPDRSADQATGKRTLCVRFGEKWAMRLHNHAILLALGISLGLFLIHWPGARFTWLVIPLALWQSATLHRYLGGSAKKYHGLTLRALGMFAMTAVLWIVGLASLLKFT